MTPQQIRDERRMIDADFNRAEQKYLAAKSQAADWLADLQSRCQHENTANVGDGGEGVECTDCGKAIQ